jgi:hypothetical protein
MTDDVLRSAIKDKICITVKFKTIDALVMSTAICKIWSFLSSEQSLIWLRNTLLNPNMHYRVNKSL